MRPLLRPHIAALIIRLYQITRVPSASLREPRDIRIDTSISVYAVWNASTGFFIEETSNFSRSLFCFCFCHSYFSEKLGKYLCRLKVGSTPMRGILVLTLHGQFESFLASTIFHARIFTIPTKDCCHSSRTQLKDLARGLLHSLNIIIKSIILPMCIVCVLRIVTPSKLSQTHKRPRSSHNFLQIYSTIFQKL